MRLANWTALEVQGPPRRSWEAFCSLSTMVRRQVGKRNFFWRTLVKILQFEVQERKMFFAVCGCQLDSLVVDLKLVPPPTFKKNQRALKLRVRACAIVEERERERERGRVIT